MKRIYQIPETEIVGTISIESVCGQDASDGEANVMSNKDMVFEEVETTSEEGQKPGLWED